MISSMATKRIRKGDNLTARAPGESFETGAVYTVLAVYDGKMDLECTRLDVTIAGVRVDDPNLSRAVAA